MPRCSRRARPPASSDHCIPSTSTCPASGRVSPSRISIVVVFPAPLGPRSPKHSPRWMVRSSPATAVTSSYFLTSPAVRIAGPSGPSGPPGPSVRGLLTGRVLVVFLGLHRVLERQVELHVDADHTVVQSPDLDVDARVPARDDGQIPGEVADGPHGCGEQLLPHLLHFARDHPGEVVDHRGLGGPARFQLLDCRLGVVDDLLELENLVDFSLLIGAEFDARHPYSSRVPWGKPTRS